MLFSWSPPYFPADPRPPPCVSRPVVTSPPFPLAAGNTDADRKCVESGDRAASCRLVELLCQSFPGQAGYAAV